jgi:photosystem II stability/assembly factor-like uncharacterized protein
MSYRGFVYRSDDRGAHWARTSFAQVPMDANDSYRTFGQKMAVDPANPDVVYVGTPQNGLFVTFDGGASWQQVATVPAAGEAGISGIAFDATSGTTGSRTRTVYASSYGNGVWRTADAGSTWARLAGGPSTVDHAIVTSSGALFVTSNDTPNEVWRFSGGAWQNVTPTERQYWRTIAVDPFNANRLVLATDGGILCQSQDADTT